MPFARILLSLAVLAASFAPVPVLAQSGNDKDKLSDAERAKRDAERVFSFIKFHTVKQAPAEKSAEKSTEKPAAAKPAARAVAAPAAQAAPQPASAGRELTLAGSAPAAAAAEPSIATADLPAATVPTPAAELAPVQSAPTVEPEEAPLKLVAYVPPEMTAQVLAAMTSSEVVVPVRFTVQPDGRVSSAQAMGSSPRRVAQAAVRAVQQWRFDRLPAERMVDVEISFRAE